MELMGQRHRTVRAGLAIGHEVERVNGAAGSRATWMGKPKGRYEREHMSQCGQRASFNRDRDLTGEPLRCSPLRPDSCNVGQRPKITFDAFLWIADAHLHMSFRHDLRARIKFAAFGEHASHRIKRIETLSFPQEVDEINNRAIEMTFNEINVIAVRGLVYRQFCAGEGIRALELVISGTDDLQRARVGQIEAVS